jgi:hypothetical protein
MLSLKTVFSSSIGILIFAFIGIFISGVFNVPNKVNGSRRKRSKMFVFSCFVVQHCLSIKELSH